MPGTKEIWVIPEISGNSQEIGELSYGLLSEAVNIAKEVGGSVKALLFGADGKDYREILGKYGISRAYFFKHPLLQHFSAGAYSAAMSTSVQNERPWMVLMGDTLMGKELAPRLAVLLDTGVVAGCVKMDLHKRRKPKFFRPVFGEQAYQELIFQNENTMLVTMHIGVLNIVPSSREVAVEVRITEPDITPEMVMAHHVDFLAADRSTVDLTEADRIVGVGMGALSESIFPLVQELAGLIEGSLGATRPVVDENKLSRERLIGQTGKVVDPQLYLALGISGASHHISGIQHAKTVISVNRDPRAEIFQHSDAGVVADLKDILPGLIARVRRAKEDGEIL